MNYLKYSQIFKNINKTQAIFLGIILAILIMIWTFAINTGMHNTVPEATARHTMAISAAISDLKHNLKGYVGYGEVLETLASNGLTINPDNGGHPEYLTNPTVLNNAIKAASSLPEIHNQQYLHTLKHEDVGLVDYYKLSFLLFGYNIQGFLYLYFLLLFISITAFFIEFRKNYTALSILIIYLSSHYLVMSATLSIGLQLQTVHNPRFLGVLMVISMLHIILYIFENQYQDNSNKISNKSLIIVLIQIIIFSFVFRIRSSSLWLVLWAMFAALTYLIYIYFVQKPKLLSNKNKLKIIYLKIFPIILVILMVIINVISTPLIVNPWYQNGRYLTAHMTWHNIYLGLASHPQLQAIYQIEPTGDKAAFDAAEKYLKSRNQKMILTQTGDYDFILYDQTIKNIVLNVLKNHPKLFLEMVLMIKPKSFFDQYFNSSYSFFNKWFLVFNLTLLVVLAFLNRVSHQINLIIILGLVIMAGFLCSLIPLLATYPALPLMADASLMFTMLVSYSIFVVFLLLFKVSRKFYLRYY